MKRLGVVGLGLIGGSVALRARQVYPGLEVVGLDRHGPHAEMALRLGLVNSLAADSKELTRDCDGIVVAVPPSQVVDTVHGLSAVSKVTWLTDVASVKAHICSALVDNRQFVGAHPIAGTEHSGPWSAKADLLVGQKCVIMERGAQSSEIHQTITRFWETLQMQVVSMTPAEHDGLFAAVSHLPHAVAFSLVQAVAKATGSTAQVAGLAGGGYRDTTRIASSAPELWADIFVENAPALSQTLARFRGEIDCIANALQTGDRALLVSYFAEARGQRAQMTGEALTPVRIDDEPGGIPPRV